MSKALGQGQKHLEECMGEKMLQVPSAVFPFASWGPSLNARTTLFLGQNVCALHALPFPPSFQKQQDGGDPESAIDAVLSACESTVLSTINENAPCCPVRIFYAGDMLTLMETEREARRLR